MLASLSKPFQGKKLAKQANPKAFSFIVSYDCHPTRESGELRVMLPVSWMKNLRLGNWKDGPGLLHTPSDPSSVRFLFYACMHVSTHTHTDTHAYTTRHSFHHSAS